MAVQTKNHALAPHPAFWATHPGYQQLFGQPHMTLGLVTPIDPYRGAVPDMENHLELAQLADKLGFQGLWLRDVPLLDPNFGDAGQTFDPWTYLGYLAGQTQQIILGTAAIVLPLRQPVHIAKSAATVDRLSNGRFILGVASGDRPIEYPSFRMNFSNRAERFRETVKLMRQLWGEEFPQINSALVEMQKTDLLPKPIKGNIPIVVAGHAQQSPEWIAQYADGWFFHPYPLQMLKDKIAQWQQAVVKYVNIENKPLLGALLIDLEDNPKAPAMRFRLGYQTGREQLIEILKLHASMGIKHLLFNLKFSRRPGKEVLQELAEEVMPALSSS